MPVSAIDMFIDPGGADYGLAASGQFEVYGGSSLIEGIAGATPKLSTNSTESYKFYMGAGSTVRGDIYVGPMSDPSVVIWKEKSAVLVGTENSPTNGVTIEAPDEPVPIGPSSGYVSYSSGTTSLKDEVLYCDRLTLSGTAVLEIEGVVEILVEGDVSMYGSAKIKFKNSRSTLLLYARGKTMIEGDAEIGVNMADYTLTTIVQVENDHMDLAGDSVVFANVIAPDSELHVKHNATFTGTGRANEVKVEGTTHVMIANAGGEGPADNGDGSVGVRVQWIENS